MRVHTDVLARWSLRTTTWVAVCCATATLGAQSPTTEPDAQSCRGCGIAISRVLVLGDHSGGISPLSRVAVDRGGRFYVASGNVPGQILVFDPRGTLLRRIGGPQPGRSPLADVTAIAVGRGDTLYAVDRTRDRIVLFSPQGNAVRAISANGLTIYSLVPLESGQLVVQGARTSPQLVGFPLHLLDGSGRLVRSIDPPTAMYRVGQFPDFRPVAPAARAGGIWLAAPNRYEVTLWSTEGRQLRTISRAPPWFRAWNQLSRPFTSPAQTAITAIHQDADGLLWVVTRVPDPTWRVPAGHPDSREAEVSSASQSARYLDTVIEVIEPDSGRVVAAAHDSGLPFRFLGDHLAYRLIDGAQGSTRVEILRVRIINSGRRGR